MFQTIPKIIPIFMLLKFQLQNNKIKLIYKSMYQKKLIYKSIVKIQFYQK